MGVYIRYASAELPSPLIVFLRNAMTFIFLLPWAIHNNFALVRTTRLKGHFWRATIGVIGMQSWFYCLTILPLNQATALSFTAPVFSTLLAVLLLKEKADIRHWLAMIIGFTGVLIILRPAGDAFDWQSTFVLFTTMIWAIAGMFIKSLTSSESPLRIVFFMVFFMALWSLPPALYMWQWPSQTAWLYMVAIAITSFGMQWCLAKAYSLTQVVKLTPFDFSRLIFTAIFAYIAFGETTDLFTWLGAAIIIGSVLINVRRDAKTSEDVVA
jgi:drug/metabolite transporter (DMT)-like permease